MGHCYDQDVCWNRGLAYVRYSQDILRQLSSGQVFYILVLLVNDLRQLATLDDFFMHPHIDTGFEELRMPHSVFTNNSGDGTSPITGSNDADLFGRHYLKRAKKLLVNSPWVSMSELAYLRRFRKLSCENGLYLWTKVLLTSKNDCRQYTMAGGHVDDGSSNLGLETTRAK